LQRQPFFFLLKTIFYKGIKKTGDIAINAEFCEYPLGTSVDHDVKTNLTVLIM
jgi:hypothetical protein